jgi:hypothetical protein
LYFRAFPEVSVVWFVGQSLVIILLAFFLGVIAGRLSVKPRHIAEQPEQKVDDELDRIEGIGPAMANALRAAGIRTFAALAECDDDTKRAAIKSAGLSFAPSLATWSQQARLLADGDEAAFAALTARLVAGRDAAPPQRGSRPSPRPRPAGPDRVTR